MPDQFTHGYALLIGVGESKYSDWSLSVTVKDMQALRAILVDPSLCAYPDDEDHVRLLHDEGATRGAILDGLAWLKGQVEADPEATAVVYYSGHGWLEKLATGEYYLIPHDIEPFDIPGSCLSTQDFTEGLRQIPAQRLLVFIDSCHAEGMATAKGEPMVKLPQNLEQAALPKGVVDELKKGEGRAVFTSSRGTQRSWTRPDEEMSIYTYHLIEALQGAGNQPGDNVVRVSNLMNHLGKAVPESAQKLARKEQVPFFDTAAEDFPVALLRGGKGLPKGGWGAVQQEARETIQRVYHAVVHGSGAIAQGPGAVAAGERGVAIGGSVQGSSIVTGDQTKIDTGGGAHIGGTVDTGGGDFVGRDKVVHGDEVHGDKVGGDKITVGDITGSTGVAIGRRAQATVTTGLSGDEIAKAFAALMQKVDALPEGSAKEDAKDTVKKLEAEGRKGDKADEGRVRRLFNFLAETAPDAWEVAVETFTNPIKGLSTAFRRIAERAKAERQAGTE